MGCWQAINYGRLAVFRNRNFGSRLVSDFLRCQGRQPDRAQRAFCGAKAEGNQQVNNASDKEYADRLLGKLFGFPQCCIDFWVNSSSKVLRRSKSKFPGLIVCPKCEHKELEEVVNDLGTRRICPQPFPLHPTEADFPSVVSDHRFSHDEQTWLQANKHRFIYKPDHSDQLLIDYYEVRSQISANFDAAIANEPGREKYFVADMEFKIKKVQVETLDAIHKLMYERVIEQLKAGHMKI